MKFDKVAFKSRMGASSHKRELKYHTIYDTPSPIRHLASKGDVLGVLKARKAIWHEVYLLIGIEAMDALGFDGMTTIEELIHFKAQMRAEPDKARQLKEAGNMMSQQ